mgnify:CR=1 FL=1
MVASSGVIGAGCTVTPDTRRKTTVRSKVGQCVVVFLVALVEMLFRLNEVVYAPFYALFFVGPAALFLEAFIDSRRQRTAPVAVGATA